MNNNEIARIGRQRLEMFERGELHLHQLVGDLTSLHDSMVEPVPVWADAFERHTFALEELNALRLYEGVDEVDGRDDFARITVAQLKLLLATEDSESHR